MSELREARPAAARPTTAILALGVALVAAVAGALVVRRAARHMPPLPPAGRPAAGGGARPEYPRLQ